MSHGQLTGLFLHAIDPPFGFADWESLSNPDVFLVERAMMGGLRARRWPCDVVALSAASGTAAAGAP